MRRSGAWALILVLGLATEGCASRGRLLLEAPGIARYRLLHPPPPSDSSLTIQFFGTASLVIRDSATAIMSDGFVTRPGPLRTQFGRLSPDSTRVRDALAKLDVDSLAAIVVGHSHFDHAMDAPEFARQADALLLGSSSVVEIGRGAGLPDDRMRTARKDTTYRVGDFALSFVESRHAPGDRYPGTIDTPLGPPQRAASYMTGTVWSMFVTHGGRTLLIQGSPGYVEGALRGRRADVVFLAVGELGRRPPEFIDAYWNEVVLATGARRVVLIHWDNFTRDLGQPLKTVPYVLDDFNETMVQLLMRASRDAVRIYVPEPWSRFNPFEGLPKGTR